MARTYTFGGAMLTNGGGVSDDDDDENIVNKYRKSNYFCSNHAINDSHIHLPVILKLPILIDRSFGAESKGY